MVLALFLFFDFTALALASYFCGLYE